MAETIISPNNKPTVQMGGMRKRSTAGAAATVPTPAAEAAGAKTKAKSLLKRGLISQAQHDTLASKADKVMSMAPAAAPKATVPKPVTPRTSFDTDPTM